MVWSAVAGVANVSSEASYHPSVPAPVRMALVAVVLALVAVITGCSDGVAGQPPTTATPSSSGLGPTLEWERSNSEGGHQPWHGDPCDTGLFFVRSVLGFSDVTEVASCEIRGDDAWVTVGYAVEGRVIPAGATIHLARLGNDPGGWTVVGSRDRATLTLLTPRYGARIGGVVHLAGEVSGLGEDVLTVRIIDRSGRNVGAASQQLIGLGGGWQADIRLPAGTDEVLIAVASTDSGLGSLSDLAITALVAGGHATP